MSDLGASAGAEWATLINTAVLGTDRRSLPAAGPGWAPLVVVPDVAIELLNRAAAVTTARRAGVQPIGAPLLMVPAPTDVRQVCSTQATISLERLLAGEHDVLLPEWLSLCQHAGLRVPSHLVPALLLRGRRDPAFDRAARAVVGRRASWLADAMPELGISAHPKPLPADAVPFLPPAPPVDSGAVVTAIVGAFLEHQATWAAAPQLRVVVAAIQPAWLPALIVELARAPFNPLTERTRVELLGIARARREMVAALQPVEPVAVVNDSPDPPAGTRVRLHP